MDYEGHELNNVDYEGHELNNVDYGGHELNSLDCEGHETKHCFVFFQFFERTQNLCLRIFSVLRNDRNSANQ